ncbi:MAG: phosphate ABC transporter permease PstA [Solirubrobacterales bacterium]
MEAGRATVTGNVAAGAVRESLTRERGSGFGEVLFKYMLIACIAIALGTLVVLLVDILADGLGSISPSFFTDTPSRIIPENSGIGPAIAGTLWLMAVCAAFIIPVGVGAAVYLEEYANPERRINRMIEVNVQNLAAVPSIVYGVLGLAFLVRGPIGMGRILIAGGLTLALLVLPVVIVAGREAIRAVPPSIREGSMALGATQWQTIWKQVLPAALPGIATGTILALSRAIGETAPLIVVGAAAFSTFSPSSPFDSITALPIQIFSWISDPRPEYKVLAAAGIIVLMGILLAMNAVAIYLRNRYEKKW